MRARDGSVVWSACFIMQSPRLFHHLVLLHYWERPLNTKPWKFPEYCCYASQTKRTKSWQLSYNPECKSNFCVQVIILEVLINQCLDPKAPKWDWAQLYRFVVCSVARIILCSSAPPGTVVLIHLFSNHPAIGLSGLILEHSSTQSSSNPWDQAPPLFVWPSTREVQVFLPL